ncbi:MAG: hypothetical protein OXC60_07470 [Litoreibacter sp.]|nr:hypothetical protein [Litoreibacter sp.]
MSDYSTHEEGLGGKALVVASVLIGIFILALAFLGAGEAPELPAGLVESQLADPNAGITAATE